MDEASALKRLQDFHSRYGFDISRLFESEPDLYQALMLWSTGTPSDDLIGEFLTRLAAVTSRATQDPEYKSTFDRSTVAASRKESVSVGFLPTDDEDDE